MQLFKYIYSRGTRLNKWLSSFFMYRDNKVMLIIVEVVVCIVRDIENKRGR